MSYWNNFCANWMKQGRALDQSVMRVAFDSLTDEYKMGKACSICGRSILNVFVVTTCQDCRHNQHRAALGRTERRTQ